MKVQRKSVMITLEYLFDFLSVILTYSIKIAWLINGNTEASWNWWQSFPEKCMESVLLMLNLFSWWGWTRARGLWDRADPRHGHSCLRPQMPFRKDLFQPTSPWSFSKSQLLQKIQAAKKQVACQSCYFAGRCWEQGRVSKDVASGVASRCLHRSF